MYEYLSSNPSQTTLKPKLSDIIWKRFGYLLEVKYKPKFGDDNFLLDIDKLIKMTDEQILKEIEDFLSRDVRRTVHTLYASLKEVRPESKVLEYLSRYFYNLYKEVYRLNGVITDKDDNIISHNVRFAHGDDINSIIFEPRKDFGVSNERWENI